MRHTHEFIKLAERYSCWEMGLVDDAPGGLIEKLRGVMPEKTNDAEVLCYRWLPPRKDPVSGQPLEVVRLQLFRVPIGKDGPLYGTITQAIDDKQAPPVKVKMPDPMDVPPEVEAMDEATLDTLAPQVGLVYPKGSDIRLKKTLLARECLGNNPRGRMVLDRIKRSIQDVAKPRSDEPKPQPRQAVVKV